MIREDIQLVVIGEGYLGRMIIRLAEDVPARTVGTRRCPGLSEAGQFDFFTDDIRELLDRYPCADVIFSASVEKDPREELLGQRFGELVSAMNGRWLAYVSSDGIFDGKNGKKRGYSEKDVPTPTTLYGRNLKRCEDILLRSDIDYCIVRPSYLYGSPLHMGLDRRSQELFLALQEGRPVYRFLDMHKSPLHVYQAASAILGLYRIRHGGVVHVAGPKMSVFDFSREVAEAYSVPTGNLAGIRMPMDDPGMLRDTSLDNRSMASLLDMNIGSVQESISTFG